MDVRIRGAAEDSELGGERQQGSGKARAVMEADGSVRLRPPGMPVPVYRFKFEALRTGML
jgi:hypothetical protein